MKKSSMTEKPDPLAESLRVKLRTLVDHKPLTPRVLLEMEQTARLARELLAVGKNPEAKPKRSNGLPSFLGSYNTGVGSGGADPYDTDDGGVTTSAPPIETFGATAMRELVAAIPALMPKPPAPEAPSLTSQVMAIAYARDKGLHELADQLENKMLGRCAAEASVSAEAQTLGLVVGSPALKKHNGKAKNS